MRIFFHSISLLLAFALVGQVVDCQVAVAQVGASPDGLWRPVKPAEIAAAAGPLDGQGFVPRNAKYFDLDQSILTRLAGRAVSEIAARANAAAARANQITIPMPDGSYQRFEIIASPVMSPALQAKFPNIKSYRGRSIDDALVSMRMDISPRGMHAQVLAPEGTIIVDPAGVGNRYRSYSKRSNRAQAERLRCLVQGRGPALATRGASTIAASSGAQLRTYRLAVACTGEYAQHFGGTKAAAMAAINTTINRVTGIYEREVSIRLELVDDNDDLLFTRPLFDPFNNSNARVLIRQSQTVIDDEIGDANYDIGHTFSTGAGGLAGLGVVGRTGQKARGVTGRSNPVGDPFDVDYVAHEIGHQFGGDHTFNGVSNSCSGGNRNSATAVEVGSGSTIQAYAGICASDNLQPNSDAYFHAISLDQIIAYSTVGGGNVVSPTPTGNAIPTVDAGPDRVIPKLTPFKLNAAGSDPDNDPLTYCWEQMDLGPAAAADDPDDGSIPLFRSFLPKTESWRVFPRWSDILHATTSRGEQLPANARNMHLRVTVRDSRSGGGGVNSDQMVVNVVDSAGPFRVTHPSGNLIPGRLLEVRWDVANTDRAPINCSNVNIRLSTDGGRTFAETLATNTKNDGRELVALPMTASQNLRILVEAADNVFFAVSKENFGVRPSSTDVFLARHAEKQMGSDPELTTAGARRANELARLMAQLGATRVFSTDTRRTRQTAMPTATAIGESVEIYADVGELAMQLNALSGARVLVVAHSDTVGEIASALGVTESISIAENEFNHLFHIGLSDGGPHFSRFKYGDAEVAPAAITPDSAPLVGRGAPLRPAPATIADIAARGARVGAPVDRFALSDRPVVYLNQNWSPAESIEFYGLRQGSPLMRKSFFDELEQPDGTGLFRDSDYLASFGFLPRRHSSDNPDGYPIGLVGGEAIELNCSACHTSRMTYGGKEYWIDGGQARTDLDRWQAELVRALKQTLSDAPNVSGVSPNTRVNLDQGTKFGRFARRLLGGVNPTAAQIRVVARLLREDYQRRQVYFDYNTYGRTFNSDSDRAAATKHVDYGFTRLDALGAILNQACAATLRNARNARPADAPVNYPAIWDAPQHDKVQWNGAVDNNARFGPLGRNAGQVIGVFGIVEPEDSFTGYDSSINFEAIKRAEALVTQLWSPAWPEDFPKDESLMAEGRAVYQANCISCHEIMDRTDRFREPNDVLVPINRPFGAYPPLATDDLVAKNWRDRRAAVGILAGRSVTLPFQGKFSDNPLESVPAREVLTHLVFKTITKSFVPWRDELTIDDAQNRSMMLSMASTNSTLMRYKSRPLNGVWSTAPYLHNGSVLDMVELLTKPADRKKTFRLGANEFDPKTLGFKDGGEFLFDTSLPGNKNLGHAYGVNLPAEKKAALIEFLKSL